MTTLKSLFELYKATNSKEDENMLDPQHSVQKHADRSGNGDEVFKASKIKQTTRKKGPDLRHGYESGEDKIVYDSHNKKAPIQTEEAGVIDERNKDNKFKKDLHIAQKGKAEMGKGINFARYTKERIADNKGNDHGIEYGDDENDVHARLKSTVRLYKHVGRKALRNEETVVLDEVTSKVGTYTTNAGAVLTLHKSDHDSRHHMLVRKSDGHVVKGYAGTSEQVHKQLTDEGLKGALHEESEIEEMRQMTPELKAAQQNLINLKSGKKVDKAPAQPTWKQHVKNHDASSKEKMLQHQEKFKHHKNQVKEYEDSLKDLHSGNLGIPKDQKDKIRGAEEEIQTEIDHHETQMNHHRDKMHYHNEMRSKPSKLKESVIDKVYNTYIADKVTPVDLEEKFTNNIGDLSEKAQSLLIGLFESLTEENQLQMIEVSKTYEGVNDLLDFALDGSK